MKSFLNTGPVKPESRPVKELTPAIMKSLTPAQIFKHHTQIINSIDFSRDGKYLATTSNDKKLIIYNIAKGDLEASYNLKSYGIDLVRFTHNPHYVLFTTSDPNDYRISYLSLWENKIFFSFLGHTDQIITLEINPLNDLFITCSKDGTARLFNLYSRTCHAIYSGAKCVGFDNTGLVLAIGVEPLDTTDSLGGKSQVINLYNVEDTDFQQNPFKSIYLETTAELTAVRFSNNSKYMMVSTSENLLLLLDAMSGDIIRKLTEYPNSEGLNLEACFTPDSKYIMTGDEKGKIHIWSTSVEEEKEEETEIAILDQQFLPVMCLQMNPKYGVLASTCQNTILWQPIE